MPAISLSSDPKILMQQAKEITESCNASQGVRAAYCRQLNAMLETGRQDGSRSIINMLFSHVDRLASHLFSPTELAFKVDSDITYDKEILNRYKVAGRKITSLWSKNNFDLLFSRGVFDSLKYGACIFKQGAQTADDKGNVVYHASLIQPWQFGVYNESCNDLDDQTALCETQLLTMPEVWRRIYHLPEAEVLFKKIRQHAMRGQAGEEYSSFFHEVLSTSTLDTGNTGKTRPTPGGIVNLNNDPNYAVLGPEVNVELAKFHELWIQDGEDYTTIQWIEPDILITRYKKGNLLINGDKHSGLHPYTLIQPNQKSGYFWGRTEIADLIAPQGLLSTWADDIKRLFGLQLDKILAFSGYDGITDETYDQMRSAGFFNGPPGATVNDLTPKFPPEGITMLQFIMQIIDQLGGFNNMLSGRGEPGVRSAQQGDQLLKVASPRLRDRALVVERQCAQAADLTLHLLQAKDGQTYWTDSRKIPETSFHFSDFLGDAYVVVDSHTSSPIFKDNHQQLIAFGVKAGLCTKHYAVDNLDFPNKTELHQEITEAEEKQGALMRQLLAKDPEALAKIVGGKRR
jgi:hypothetical protein